MFGRKKKKKREEKEPIFKREVYIPKKRLDKRERTVTGTSGKNNRSGGVGNKNGKGRKAIIFFLWIFFLGEIVYVLLFANFFTIQSLRIERERASAELSDEQIQEYTELSWQGQWLGFIPKNNLLLLRPDAETKRLQERFPRFDSVRVERSFPENLTVFISEKPFQILWCKNDDCFLVDNEGKTASSEIFFRHSEEQGKIVRIQDTAQIPVSLGTTVLRPEDQQFIKDIMTDFSLRTELQIEGSIERPNLYAREMRIRTDKGFIIFFNTELPVSQSLNSLMLVLQNEIPTGEWDKIDYIDLRTENRVYYTRKDRAPEKTEAQKLREEAKEKAEEEERKKQESQGN